MSRPQTTMADQTGGLQDDDQEMTRVGNAGETAAIAEPVANDGSVGNAPLGNLISPNPDGVPANPAAPTAADSAGL